MVSSPTLSAFLHDLCHEIAHLFCCAFLHLPCNVRVGAKGKSRVEMAEHTGHCFHVHAILERQRCECVSQVMKSQVFQSRVLQDFLVDVDHRIRMVHLARFRGWEHPWVVGVLLVLCGQQLDSVLRNRDFADGVFRFRPRDIGFACVVSSRQLFQWNISDVRRDVQFDAAPVILYSRESQMRFCV